MLTRGNCKDGTYIKMVNFVNRSHCTTVVVVHAARCTRELLENVLATSKRTVWHAVT